MIIAAWPFVRRPHAPHVAAPVPHRMRQRVHFLRAEQRHVLHDQQPNRRCNVAHTMAPSTSHISLPGSVAAVAKPFSHYARSRGARMSWRSTDWRCRNFQDCAQQAQPQANAADSRWVALGVSARAQHHSLLCGRTSPQSSSQRLDKPLATPPPTHRAWSPWLHNRQPLRQVFLRLDFSEALLQLW